MNRGAGQITLLLIRLKDGDPAAESELVPLVYNDLRRMAARYMQRERPDHTLQATALLHEAFLRLVDQKHMDWQGRAHFFAVASRVMRRILVDHARRIHADKRAGKLGRVDLETALIYSEAQSGELVALDEALNRLVAWDARQSKIVEMRFFGGLSIEETAEVLGISARTVKRDWSMARAWLYGELNKAEARDRRTLEPS